MLSSGAFDPETINVLTTAYERGCAALDVADRADPLKEAIAKAIIERAKAGERDASRLCEAVLKEPSAIVTGLCKPYDYKLALAHIKRRGRSNCTPCEGEEASNKIR